MAGTTTTLAEIREAIENHIAGLIDAGMPADRWQVIEGFGSGWVRLSRRPLGATFEIHVLEYLAEDGNPPRIAVRKNRSISDCTLTAYHSIDAAIYAIFEGAGWC